MRTHDDVRPARLAPRLAMAAAASLAVLVAGLTGCAAPIKYTRPDVKINQDWNERADERITTRGMAERDWWNAFRDPALDQLVQLAFKQNLPLRSTGLRIYEARAQLALAVGRQYPQIQEAFANATGVGTSEHAANSAGLNRHFADYQVGFDATWELDFWGRYREDIKAETAQYLGSIADYDTALVSLTAEVARTYAVLRTFEVLLDQAQTNATLQEEGLRIAQARFKYGATSELDVTQATTLLESTRATIPQLEAGRQQSENALATLIGQPTGSVASILTGSSGIPVAPAEVAISVPAELLRRRPDVRSAELFAASQAARIGVARADLYPRFTLFGSVGFQTSTGGGFQSNHSEFHHLFDSGSLFYAFGPRLVWPIFNYGRIKNNIRIQDARYQQLLVDYQATVLKAAQEVEDGLVGYLKAQESTTFASNAVTAAQRSVDLSMSQYREGAVDFQRVLDAQRSLLEEENTLAQTRSSIATSLISLYKALGGGWEIREGQHLVPDQTIKEMQDRTNWGDLLSAAPPMPETQNASSPR